jgi:hypothetical protein
MDIAYLDIRTDNDAPNREALSGRTEGCGCCSDNVDIDSKKAALEQLATWETELKTDLVKVKELRTQVRKWKK